MKTVNINGRLSSILWDVHTKSKNKKIKDRLEFIITKILEELNIYHKDIIFDKKDGDYIPNIMRINNILFGNCQTAGIHNGFILGMENVPKKTKRKILNTLDSDLGASQLLFDVKRPYAENLIDELTNYFKTGSVEFEHEYINSTGTEMTMIFFRKKELRISEYDIEEFNLELEESILDNTDNGDFHSNLPEDEQQAIYIS